MNEITRRVGETVLLGSDIRITILGVEGSNATLGVQDLSGKLQGGLTETGDTPARGFNAPMLSGRVMNGD
jgi:hypothetical protein